MNSLVFRKTPQFAKEGTVFMGLSSELLFYGGIILVCIGGVGFLVSLLIFQVITAKLQVQLDAEYGKARSR